MIFNSNNISVVCTEYVPFKDQTIIEVEAEKSFKLNVVTKYLGGPKKFNIPQGKTVLKI
jgi:hypothetical protein